MASYGTLTSSTLNGVKVYNVAGGRSLPDWLSEKKKRALRKDADYLRRIELIQDMEFPAAATRLKTTPDGQFLVASGVYPPQLHVYELSQLSMKFVRHVDAEIIDFQLLADDYSKIAMLCSDRSICFHAKFGAYFSTRVPRMGRDLTYDRWSCDLIVAASSPEVYRLNLEQGQFLPPLVTRSPGINVIGRSPVFGLLACGGEDGAVEFFDQRQKRAVARIDAVGSANMGDQEVTAIRFEDTDSMQVAVGTSGGQVLLYDLRSTSPLRTKDHMYGSPIVDIKWHSTVTQAQRQLITSDSKIVKIWDPVTGNNLTSVEPGGGGINDVCAVKGSGLILMALDMPKMQSFFIPALGPAPRWCSFLDNLTEEMEETGETVVYEDFKFVTREELDRLNLSSLLGSNLLRAYMHGFFIDARLYHKAKVMTDPFAYEVYRQKRIEQKMDAERASRITVKRKLPKVNAELAARLMAEETPEGTMEGEDDKNPSKKRKKKGTALNTLMDERFSALFTDQAFTVNDQSDEYKALHGSTRKVGKPTPDLDEHFDLIDEDDGEEDENDEEDDEGNGSEDNRDARNGAMASKSRGSEPRLYVAKDEAHATAFRNNVSLKEVQSLPLEERVAAVSEKQGGEVKRVGGSREFKLLPKSFGERERFGGRDTDEKSGKYPARRSVKSLGLPGDRSPGRGGFRGRGGRGGGGRGGGGRGGGGRGGGGRGGGGGGRGRGGRGGGGRGRGGGRGSSRSRD